MTIDSGEGKRAPLFEKIHFSAATARNRIVMAPVVTNFATSDNEVTEKQITYYAERARGGVGTLIVEASAVQSGARAFERQVGIYADRQVRGLTRLARAIREEGAVALIQLHHAGPKVNTEIGLESVSVSPVAIREGVPPRPLSTEELVQARRDFVDAAHRARDAGFEGIELHAAHFYLLSSSISPFTNNRQDVYGGSLDNRARLTREIIENIKSEIGSDFAVWVRINGYEELDGGLSMDESRKAAAIFAKAGADAVHVSAYTRTADKSIKTRLVVPVGAGIGKDTPPGPYLKYARSVKKGVAVPVVAVGKLDQPAVAERALVAGDCDMVAMARQLLCDPYWAVKVAEGREDDIVHCKYCESCFRDLHNAVPIRCSQNLNLYGQPRYKKSL